MAFSEFEKRMYSKLASEYCEENGPPPHLYDQLQLLSKLEEQSIIIYELRPSFKQPAEKIEWMVAKATYLKSTKKWKIYYQAATLKWKSYEPCPEVNRLEEFFMLLEVDAYHHFFA